MIFTSYERKDALEIIKVLHKEVFGDSDFYDYDCSNFDSLIVVEDEEQHPIIYYNLKFLDKKSVVIEFGGALPKYRNSAKVFRAFRDSLDKINGVTLFVLVTNTSNVPMQKLALACGFLVTGLTMSDNGLCLEYSKKVGE